MIDWVSLEKNEVDFQKLRDNARLEWDVKVDNNGEVKYYDYLLKLGHYSDFTGLYLRLRPYYSKGVQIWNLSVKNSLHKFFHGNNYCDFSFIEVCTTIEKLCEIMDIPPNQFKVKSFEFGVNIETPVTPQDIFKNYLLHRRNRFEKMPYNGAKGIKCTRSEMLIKVYDKGNEYNLNKYLNRFEVKATRMRWIRETAKVPIYTLKDFTDKETFSRLSQVLINVYDEIKKLENVDLDLLKDERQRKTVSDGRTTDWYRLNEESKDKFTKRWQRFNELQQAAKKDDIHNDVKRLISTKWNQLLTARNEKKPYQDSPHLDTSEKDQLYQDSPFSSIVNLGNLNSENLKELTLVQERRFLERKCVVCCADISNRKGDTRTCSRKCRNAKSNSYQNKLKKVKRDLQTPVLFDVVKLIDWDSLQVMC